MKRLSYICAAALLSGCVYPYNVVLDQEPSPAPVAEGYIVIGGTSTLELRGAMTMQGVTRLAPMASAYIEDQNGKRYDSHTYGSYHEFDTEEATAGLSYKMVFTSDGNVYESEWLTPVESAPTIEGVKFTADDSFVYVNLSFSGGEGSTGYAATQIEETWEFHADYLRQYEYDRGTNTVEALDEPDDAVYYCWRTFISNRHQLIDFTETDGHVKDYTIQKFSRYDGRNHRKYSVLVKLRNIPADEYRYRKVQQDNSTLGGDLFSPDPGEIDSNLRCTTNPEAGVLGYVSICQAVKERYFLDDRFLLTRDPGGLILLEEDQYADYDVMGFYPIDYVMVSGVFGVGWGERRCFDCRAAGGTQVQPDYWL